MKKTESGRAPGRPKHPGPSVSIRDTVLAEASRMFMEHGFAHVSLNQIAEKAGVTKASVYYYFPNKADLFTAAVTEMMKRIAAVSSRILAGEESLSERLETIAKANMAASHGEFETMMREALPSLSESQQEEIRQAEHGIHKVLADCFARAIEDGELAPGLGPMLLAYSFSAMMRVGNREAHFIGVSEEELPRRIVELFWNGAGRRG
ncbi:TetR family transcriptional regulator [Cohnella zeiphila]|uniref:TetR/AcrR family transcriptional regulator n=1 Tax=Cohnella zeiphila TaxID=2761120 RepID=A0A7X0SH04_9BACL|nr:TetR/AcrR family transcriptional regulator [Cohnella zeiphila]